MSSWKDTIITTDATIHDAIRVIDEASLQLAMVVGHDHRLVGVITDGDVRRGILRGLPLTEPATSIMARTPTVVTDSDDREKGIELMRKHDIAHVPVVDAEGRPVGLEVLRQHLGGYARDTWVVVMAGGLGQRLAPLTDSLPKPLLRVGATPILENIVKSLGQQGFRRIFLSVNYMADKIRGHFEDGGRWGVEISYLVEEERRGTAGSLALLPETPTSPVMVMNGDLLTNVNFAALLDSHHRSKACATMCVREYTMEVPYGVVSVDGQRLVGFSEKPRHSFFINAGIYVLNPETLGYIPANEFFDMPSLFLKLMDSKNENGPMAFPVREYWLDIGRLDDLEKARSEAASIMQRP